MTEYDYDNEIDQVNDNNRPKKTILLVLLGLALVTSLKAYTIAPDGSYVGGDTFTITPDGSYVSGEQFEITPDGSYVSSEPEELPEMDWGDED